MAPAGQKRRFYPQSQAPRSCHSPGAVSYAYGERAAHNAGIPVSKQNTLWLLAIIALLSFCAGLEYQLHRRPVGIASAPTVKPPKIPPVSTAFVEPVKDKSMSGETGEPIGLEPVAPVADLEQPTVDRDFAAAAAKRYVEAYQRQHPALKGRVFAWDQSQVIFKAASGSSTAEGYLAVFFPSEGPGGGYTCFNMRDTDHLEPDNWGYVGNLNRAVENFRKSKICTVPLL